MTPDFCSQHLNVAQYGSFTLTDAVRPGPGIPVRPRQGYRLSVFRDRRSQLRIPVLSAAVSAESLFDVFIDLMKPLGETVHVVLESTHGTQADQANEYRRQHIDTSVLASHFCDFEDLLLNDGCSGVAILSARGPIELQFDEHKLIHVYAENLKPFRRILRAAGVRRWAQLALLSDAEHLHHTTDDFEEQFQLLCTRVGVADFDRVLSDEF